MKKDIQQLKVKDVAIAVIPDGSAHIEFWEVYLVNLKGKPLKNVLINSTGYGVLKGEQVKTTTLRYFYEKISSETYEKVEVIQHKLTDLANEYWLSFSLDGYMYDRKYVFVKGSLVEANLTIIPILGKKGVMIR